ncbi:hypothetical protein M758_9G024600 [Ceratodon purpureus]|nr:hypothetical protein M758_9G024600 [Ceratodon purpureus]
MHTIFWLMTCIISLPSQLIVIPGNNTASFASWSAAEFNSCVEHRVTMCQLAINIDIVTDRCHGLTASDLTTCPLNR